VTKFYFLREDILILEERINALHKEIKDLALEQGEANRQSSENFGHDDACQEAVYYRRTVVLSQLKDLVLMLNNAVVIEPQKKFERVRFGATVKLSDGRIMRIGSYAIYAQHPMMTISYSSLLGKSLIGKQVGDTITINNKEISVDDVY